MTETQRPVMGQAGAMPGDTSRSATDPTPRHGGAYLPKLPDGWEYGVSIVRDSSKIHVIELGESFRVTVNPSRPDGAFLTAPTLAEALRAAVKAAKTLDKVAELKAAAKAAEQEMLADLQTADDSDDPTDPTRDEKVPV